MLIMMHCILYFCCVGIRMNRDGLNAYTASNEVKYPFIKLFSYSTDGKLGIDSQRAPPCRNVPLNAVDSLNKKNNTFKRQCAYLSASLARYSLRMQVTPTSWFCITGLSLTKLCFKKKILLSPYNQGLMSQVHAGWCFSWSRMDQPTATPADRQNLRLSPEQMRCAKGWLRGVESKLVNQSSENILNMVFILHYLGSTIGYSAST